MRSALPLPLPCLRRRYLHSIGNPGCNLGDEVQGIAAVQWLPKVDMKLERDNLRIDKYLNGADGLGPVTAFLNAWCAGRGLRRWLTYRTLGGRDFFVEFRDFGSPGLSWRWAWWALCLAVSPSRAFSSAPGACVRVCVWVGLPCCWPLAGWLAGPAWCRGACTAVKAHTDGTHATSGHAGPPAC